ncbi:tripartite tricarboxylate transporter TctB family protein [Brenneria sp. g21c3]|uniref:tripartite tricarboxylate transporter TctB family protein n=1 Tax=Brenneria sp. g21c3 TaxID=3093893 RepID=UPI002EAF988B|nr:tripartite tricarboxylate transporter TctB family protein [Brenneria sp. g21c3]
MALKLNPSRWHTEFFFALLWIAIAAGIYVGAAAYSPSSAIFPRALAMLLALGGLAQTIRLYRRRTHENGAPRRLLDAPLRVAIGFLMVAAYILLMNAIGYIAASLLFGVTLPLLAGYRRLWPIFASVTGSLLLIVTVFRILLDRPLPPGIVESLLERAL